MVIIPHTFTLTTVSTSPSHQPSHILSGYIGIIKKLAKKLRRRSVSGSVPRQLPPRPEAEKNEVNANGFDIKDKKQNVFDEFIAAAEWLIDKGYTKSQKLAIASGSNGGFKVGACMTQRPDFISELLYKKIKIYGENFICRIYFTGI